MTSGVPAPAAPDRNEVTMDAWEYLIVALPQFEAPTNAPGASPAVHRLNEVGERGWEAIGMATLSDNSIAVLCKRPSTATRAQKES
ncbi:MAG TPA: hypothetical protein VNF07_03115 [Acidimicrobiales bacterium]|nr:hypothetical protein [Acidimicrobiales bacterium]